MGVPLCISGSALRRVLLSESRKSPRSSGTRDGSVVVMATVLKLCIHIILYNTFLT